MPLSRIKPQMESSQLRLDSSAASTDVNDRVLLNGTDSSSTGDGYAVILEDATANADTSQMLPQRANGLLSFSEPPVELFTPVFKIFAGTDQAISDATATVIQLDSTIGAYGTAGIDNANNFNTTHDFPTNLGVANFLDTSNYRVKPTIAGYYQINASARCGTNVDLQDFILYLYKHNATESANYAVSRMRHLGITNDDISSSAINVSDIVHFNGVDDYIDLRIYLVSEDGQNATIVKGFNNCFISGHLIARDR